MTHFVSQGGLETQLDLAMEKYRAYKGFNLIMAEVMLIRADKIAWRLAVRTGWWAKGRQTA